MKNTEPVFSIDKLISEDKRTCKIIVLFMDNTCIEKEFVNNKWATTEYAYLRKHKLGITL